MDGEGEGGGGGQEEGGEPVVRMQYMEELINKKIRRALVPRSVHFMQVISVG